MNCPNCGEEININDKFCKSCGEDIDLEPGKCIECGTIGREEDKFCRNCGSQLSQDISKEEAAGKFTVDEDFYAGKNFDYSVDYEDLYTEKAEKDNPRILEIIGSFFSGKSRNKDQDQTMDKEDLKEDIKDMDKESETQEKSPRPQETDQVEGPRRTQIAAGYTSKLPIINEDEEDLAGRKILSEEKKRLYEESKEKAGGNEDFDLGQPIDGSNLEKTQKLDLSELENIQTEIRKVKVREGPKKQVRNDPDQGSQAEDKKKKDKAGPKDPDGNIGSEDSPSPDTSGANRPGGPGKGPYILAIIIIVIIGAILALVLGAKTSKASVISDFERALREDDLGSVNEYIVSSGFQEISPESTAAFTRLMKTNDLFRSALIGAIKEDANKLDRDSDYQSTRPYRLEDTGRKYIFFPDYRIVLDPIAVNIQAADGQEYSFAGSKYEGPQAGIDLIPGMYPLSIPDPSFEDLVNISNTNQNFNEGQVFMDLSDIGSLEDMADPDEILLMDEEEDSEESEDRRPDLEGGIRLSLVGQDGAKVFINGEDTGCTVEEFNQLEGVNIKNGDRIQLLDRLPWTSAMTEEVVYEGQDTIELSASIYSEETMEVIMDKVVQMLGEDEEARAQMSMDPYTTLIDPELTTAENMIAGERANNIILYRDYHTMAFDPSSFDIYENPDGSYTAYIGGIIEYESTEISPEELDQVEGIDIEEIRGFHLTYLPEEDWFVNLWGYTERYIDTTEENLIVKEIN